MKETKERENKGITLVALVITIIVLLILAGVGIGAIAGPDGLISKAKQSAEQYNQSAINEAETINDLLNILGDDKETIIKGITAPDINKNPSAYYGKEVIYTPQNGAPVGWKIFYADDENIYLIATYCIENKYAPDAANGTAINKKSTYEIYFDNIIQDTSENVYSGTIDVKQEDKRLTKWISHIDSFTSTHNNMKATAYLLDTSIWNGFKDIDNKAEYIIGGPTLELFIASYNDIHSNKIDYEITNQIGYNIKWSTEDNYLDRDGIGELGATEYLYINDITHVKVNGYWIASPSYYSTDGLFAVNCNGKLYRNYYYYDDGDGGFRPVICLKSECKLLEQEDGKYVIQ